MGFSENRKRFNLVISGGSFYKYLGQAVDAVHENQYPNEKGPPYHNLSLRNNWNVTTWASILFAWYTLLDSAWSTWILRIDTLLLPFHRWPIMHSLRKFENQTQLIPIYSPRFRRSRVDSCSRLISRYSIVKAVGSILNFLPPQRPIQLHLNSYGINQLPQTIKG